MGKPKLPKFDYYLDESDPDVVVLRRQDNSFVAAFSARGATREGIMEAAKEDYRLCLSCLRAGEERVSFLGQLPEHAAIVDRSGTIVVVNKAWKRFARDNGADLGKVFEGANYLDVCERQRASRPSTPNPLPRGFIRFCSAGRNGLSWNIPATRLPRGVGS